MKKLTIQDISHPRLEHEPIWVVNNTQDPNRGPVIFVLEKQGTTERNTIIIPDSWLPQNLIEHAPRQDIIASTYFRTVLQTGALLLIDSEEAERLLALEGAEEEVERLSQSFRLLSRDVDTDTYKGLPPRVTALIQDIEGSDKTDIEIVNALRRCKISIDDLRILFRKAKANDRTVLAKHIKATAKKLKNAEDI